MSEPTVLTWTQPANKPNIYNSEYKNHELKIQQMHMTSYYGFVDTVLIQSAEYDALEKTEAALIYYIDTLHTNASDTGGQSDAS